jgi:hypothetical protein
LSCQMTRMEYGARRMQPGASASHMPFAISSAASTYSHECRNAR